VSSNQTKKKEYTPSVTIYNSLLRSGTYKLSVIELYFYILLAKRKSNYDDKVIITLNTIYKLQTLYTVEGNNTTGNMKKIRSILISMQNKNVISINVDVTDKKTAKNDDVLVISFQEIGYEKGYLSADASILDVTDDTHKLYILCFIAHQKDKQMNQSIDGWATILNCDYKTAKTHLDELQNEGLIHCVVGEKYIDGNGNYKQHPTRWLLGGKVVDENKSIEHGSEVKESVNETNINDESTIDTVKDSVTNYGNWYVKDSKLTSADYDIYIKEKDNKEFRVKADARLNAIRGFSRNNPEGNETSIARVAKLIEEAQERADKKVREQENEIRKDKKYEIIKNRYKGIIFEDPAQQQDLVLIEIDTFKNMSAKELRQFRTLYYDFIDTEYSNKYYEQTYAFNGNSTGEQSLIAGCKDDTILKIRDKIVEQFIKHEQIQINELLEYRELILAEKNKDIPYDVEHEGDLIICTPWDVSNESLKARTRKYSKTKKVRAHA